VDFEISNDGALIGCGTADFTDSWVYDQASDTYALDAEMGVK